jgi:hypothetical protein
MCEVALDDFHVPRLHLARHLDRNAWEESDRIWGKRLKELIPILLDAMERHGHLDHSPEVRSKLLRISSATIEQSLRAAQEKTGQRGRRCRAACSAVRRSILVCAFSEDSSPEFMETDLWLTVFRWRAAASFKRWP